MDERQHTPEESDYARGYRMSIVELESLRGQLASSEATITALRDALEVLGALMWEPTSSLVWSRTPDDIRAEVSAALALVPPAVGQGEK